MLILTSILSPVRVCFFDDADLDSWWLIYDIIFDVYFVLDILVNFISAFYNSSN